MAKQTAGQDRYFATDEIVKDVEKLISFHEQQQQDMRDARTQVSGKVIDAWYSWRVNFTTLSFGLAGALVAILSVVEYQYAWQYVLFLTGIGFLLVAAVWLLLSTKAWLDDNSRLIAEMFYEEEYYSQVLRDGLESLVDQTRGLAPHQYKAFVMAKKGLDKLSRTTLEAVEARQSHVDGSPDAAIVLFLLGLACAGISTLGNSTWALALVACSLMLLTVLLVTYRKSEARLAESHQKRKLWVEKKRHWIKNQNK